MIGLMEASLLLFGVKKTKTKMIFPQKPLVKKLKLETRETIKPVWSERTG